MIIFFSALFLGIYLSILLILITGLFTHTRPNMGLATSIPGITIIVVTCNEEDNIAGCINALIKQDYLKEKIQILIIDDASRDDTYNIALDFASLYSFIKVIKKKNSAHWKSRKKEALNQALKYATGEFLFLTDADCRPVNSWIKDTLAQFNKDTGLIAGFSPQVSTEGSFWNGFLFMDSLSAAFVSAGTIGLKHGITCTGRNLAIRMQTIKDVGGYEQLPDSISGDDDFILQQVTRHPKWNAGYSFDKTTHVPAAGPEHFAAFIKQKKRHLSAGKYFNLKQQTGYAIYHFTNFGLWIIAIISLWTHIGFVLALLLKIFADWVAFKLFTKKLRLDFHFIHFLGWEVLFPAYHIFSGPGAFWGKIYWKTNQNI